MIFAATKLPGVVLIEPEPIGDARGYFMRTFCAREFAANGLNPNLAQTSMSFNAKRGTLRGLHFQCHPAMEDKLVRCTKGCIFDVMVDIRPRSPSFGQWVGYELSESNHRQLYAPRGFAHGFQTLAENSVVLYHIAQFYEPERTAGVRWDDPAIGIAWPLAPTVQSSRDLALPRLAELDRSHLMPFSGGI